MSASLIAFLLAAAPAPPSDYQRDIERAVFELCPEMMAGRFSVADEAQVAAAGYAATAPLQLEEGTVPRAVHGSGAEQIFIAGSGPGSAPMCSVWFAGAEDGPLARAVKRRARANGFAGNALRLRSGERVTVLVSRAVSPPRVIMMSAAEPGSGFPGAATYVTVLNSGQ